jgi:hypothetical protein
MLSKLSSTNYLSKLAKNNKKNQVQWRSAEGPSQKIECDRQMLRKLSSTNYLSKLAKNNKKNQVQWRSAEGPSQKMSN